MPCEILVNLGMPGHRLTDTCAWILVPIVLSSGADEYAAILLNGSNEFATLHAITNSPTRRIPGILPLEIS